jgi:hypothetical protein
MGDSAPPLGGFHSNLPFRFVGIGSVAALDNRPPLFVLTDESNLDPGTLLTDTFSGAALKVRKR